MKNWKEGPKKNSNQDEFNVWEEKKDEEEKKSTKNYLVESTEVLAEGERDPVK